MPIYGMRYGSLHAGAQNPPEINEIFERYTAYFETMLRDAKTGGMPGITDTAVMAQEMISYITGVFQQAKLKNDIEIIKRDLQPGLMRYLSPGTTAYKITEIKISAQKTIEVPA